jgi:hypothetical protein
MKTPSFSEMHPKRAGRLNKKAAAKQASASPRAE